MGKLKALSHIGYISYLNSPTYIFSKYVYVLYSIPGKPSHNVQILVIIYISVSIIESVMIIMTLPCTYLIKMLCTEQLLDTVSIHFSSTC